MVVQVEDFISFLKNNTKTIRGKILVANMFFFILKYLEKCFRKK